MLTITIPAIEAWDEKHEIFVYTKAQTIRLEHSLVSISKWESKWHKPFLPDEKKTNEEMLDYFRCMTITQNVDENLYACIPPEKVQEISDYIENPMSATVFYDKHTAPRRKERITSEKIYFWMVINGIPFECQTWHLNRLMNLIHYCNGNNQPRKKRLPNEIAQEYSELNAARKKQFKTRG